MEFEQIQNGEFSEDNRKRRRYYPILITLLLLIFLSLTVGYFWYVSKDKSIDVGDANLIVDRQVLESIGSKVDLKVTLSSLEQKIFDLSERIEILEQNVVTLKESNETELSEQKQMELLQAKIESLEDSYNVRFEDLKNKSPDPEIDTTALVAIENYLIRANRYLSDEQDPRNASLAIKSAESLVGQLAPNLRQDLGETLQREISRLEQLAEMPIYQLPKMLNKLILLIGNMAIDTKISANPKSDQASQSLEVASKKGVVETLWIELKSLVTVNDIDHELVNKFSVDDARLIRLNLRLEATVAKAAFWAGNLDLLQASLNNLERLTENYLSGKSPIAELLKKINSLDIDLLVEEESHLRNLVKRVRDLRLSQGFGG